MERDRAKAAKKAARQKAKAERRNQDDDTVGGDNPTADTPSQPDPTPNQD